MKQEVLQAWFFYNKCILKSDCFNLIGKLSFCSSRSTGMVEDEHLIPAVGSSSSNVNQTSSCCALLLYAVVKKGSCDKLVYCRTIFGID